MNEENLLTGPIFSMPIPALSKATEHLTAYRGWAYSAVRNIVNEVAQVEIKLFKKKMIRNKGQVEIEIQEIHEHEALSLLYHANPFMTQTQLIEITQTYLELVGEAAWALVRKSENAKPHMIIPLRPDWVKPVPGKSASEYISHYEYNPGFSYEVVIIQPQDMVFFKNPNPLNPYRGYGAVAAGAFSLDIDEFSNDWIRTFFFNAAMPSVLLMTDQPVKEAEAKRLMERWRSEFQGRKNSNKVALLPKGLKADTIETSAKEMDFIEGKKYFRDEVLAMFHTSKANLGVVEDVNRANQEASDARFKRSVVKPKMVTLVGYLNEFFLRDWANEGLFFDFVDPTPADNEQKFKLYDSALGKGGGAPWLTINEVRELENYEPVDGGDNLYLPFTVQPVGAAKGFIKGLFGKKGKKEEGLIVLKAKKKSEQQKLKDSLTLPIPPARLSEIKQHALKEEITHDLMKLVVNMMGLSDKQVKKMKSTNQVKEQTEFNGKEAYWKALVARADVYEESMKTKLSILLEQQKELVVNNLYDSQKVSKRDLENILFNLEEQITVWGGSLTPFIREIVREASEQAFDFLGMPRSLDLTTDEVVAFLTEDGFKFIGSANETLRKRLATTLLEGIEEGEGIPALEKRIEQFYDTGIPWKSEQIARSETMRATNFATHEAYRQSGVVTGKEWLTAVDERVCPWCNEMDTRVQDLNDSYFSLGESLTVEGQTLNFDYTNVDYPPLHPGCRCTLIPVLLEKSKQPETKDIKEVVKDERVGVHEQKLNELSEKLENLNKQIEVKHEEYDEVVEEEKRGFFKELKEVRQRIREAFYDPEGKDNK